MFCHRLCTPLRENDFDVIREMDPVQLLGSLFDLEGRHRRL